MANLLLPLIFIVIRSYIIIAVPIFSLSLQDDPPVSHKRLVPSVPERKNDMHRLTLSVYVHLIMER